MNKLKEIILEKLEGELVKIGITELKYNYIILDEKPKSICPDGETIYPEGNQFCIIVTERGKVIVEKMVDNIFELLYELLDDYIIDKASQIAWDDIKGDYLLYGDRFDDEKVKLFGLIDSEYAKIRKKQNVSNKIKQS